MGRYTSGGVGRDIVAGAIAGVAAVWVIDKMQLALTHPAAAKDVDPAHQAAGKLADKMGADLGDRQNNNVGHTVHYGVGAGIGALYGLLRGMAPSVATGRGALFGLGAFLLGDEVGAPALGLAKSPLDYPAHAHARGALSHTLFGVFTDLGTRLIAPWRDEVVIYHGPSVGERLESGRQALADGRDYVYDRGRTYYDRGRAYASDAADELRARADELDVAGWTERGRRGVRQAVDRVREYLPDADDVSDVLESGKRHAREFARDVQSRLPDRDDIEEATRRGRKKAKRYADDLRSRLPDRDDLNDAVEEGRSRGRRFARDVQSRLPSRDEAVDYGRRRVRDLSDQAEEHANSIGSRLSRWLFG